MKSTSPLSAASEITLGMRRETAAKLYLIGVFAILAIHLARSCLPITSASSFVLGSAPNFVAALCMPAAVPALVGPLLTNTPRLSPKQWALVCFAATQIGLVGWELLQPSVRGMVFDVNDIVATVMGGLLWFPVIRTFSGGIRNEA